MPIAPSSAAPASSIDHTEVMRFNDLAAAWWDASGPMAPLHKLNPVRLAYLRDRLSMHFDLAADAARPLAGLSVLDIGCGGGLLAEPLCRLGAEVTAIDAAPEAVSVAQAHAEASGLAIAYACTTAEALHSSGLRFDAVIASEVVEHVADVPAFLGTSAALVGEGGAFALSTINRTITSLLIAKIAAEYVLRLLPRGTHDWHRFRTPSEVERHLAAPGLRVRDRTGMIFDPLRDEWRLSERLAVNYWVFATR